MGAARHAEDSDARRGIGPKLTVTGRLHGTLFGRPVAIEANGRDFLLAVPGLRTAWRLRRSASSGLLPVLRKLREHGFALRVRIGRRLTLDVLPEAHIAIRLFAPGVRLSKVGSS